MTIGERIKQRREELGYSQDELAKKTGYKSRSSINKIELSRDLPLNKVEKMAKALEVEPAYLMGWTVDEVGEIEVIAKADNIGLQANRLEPYNKINNERLNKALALYEQYENSIPEIKAAVDGLLKSAQPKK